MRWNDNALARKGFLVTLSLLCSAKAYEFSNKTGTYERQKNKTHYPLEKVSADNLFGDLEFS